MSMVVDPQPRLPLTRERILAAALELADEAGVRSITMRKLGDTLGFEAMSLYNYVSSKDDVLDGLVDLVLAETEPISPTGDWAAAIRSSAVSVHEALRRHAWASALLLSPERIRPARLRYMDSLLGRLREAGFSAETTFTAYHILDGHIIGFSLWESKHTFTAEQAAKLASAFEREITVEAYPYLREHGEQHFTEGPHRDVSAFELGLDLILDGLQKIREQDRAQA